MSRVITVKGLSPYLSDGLSVSRVSLLAVVTVINHLGLKHSELWFGSVDYRDLIISDYGPVGLGKPGMVATSSVTLEDPDGSDLVDPLQSTVSFQPVMSRGGTGGT